MNLREQFEKLHPVPEGVSWSDGLGMYACEFLAYQGAEKRQNGLWQGFQSGHAAGLEQQAKRITELEAENARLKTPAAKWREAGKPDPLGDYYDCERAKLCMGHLTDDELANEVFMKGGIGELTAAKERIRWLSRLVVKLQSHSANTVGGPTPVTEAAPACEQFIKRVRDAWIASAETRLKDLRVSDLTTKQLRADAAELWVRKNLHFVNEYCEGLLLQIDLLRANCSPDDTRNAGESDR